MTGRHGTWLASPDDRGAQVSRSSGPQSQALTRLRCHGPLLVLRLQQDGLGSPPVPHAPLLVVPGLLPGSEMLPGSGGGTDWTHP